MNARNVLREPLPNRRSCDSRHVEHQGLKYTAQIGRYDDGRLAEVFMSSTKVGTGADTNARDASVILSLALQHGCPLESVRKALTREPSGEASGPLGQLLDALAAEDGAWRPVGDFASAVVSGLEAKMGTQP